MNKLRVSMIVLYAFLVSVALILFAFAWSRVTNQFFGMRFTNSPAWFEVGMQWFVLALAIGGALASVLSCWGLARRKSWTPPLVNTIAWFMLFFYPGISFIIYVGAAIMTKVRVPFFVMFDYKTIILAVLSIAALAILRSKWLRIQYDAPFRDI